MLFIFCSFSYSLPGLSKSFIATVTQVRGKVSKLVQGQMSARKVNVGDKLFKETSLVTKDKSFVQVVFKDKSILSLGPNGKLILNKMKVNKPGLVTLLKGNLRTKIEKNSAIKKHKNKFYVRTRSAAMGVRGTEFQTLYNPSNKITSLLTYNGEVAMAKYDPNTPLDTLQTRRVRREVIRRGRKVEVRDIVLKGKSGPRNMEEHVKSALNGKEAVVVKRGQYSGVVHSLGRTSLPVKINPVQYRALYQNREFKDKFLKKELFVSSGSSITKDKNPIVMAPQDAPEEGFFDPKTGEFAPKSGGLVDFSTALYIPPGEAAEYHGKTGTFIPSKVGNFDAETGQYIPPKGLVLDSKKGFIISDRKVRGEKKQILLAMRSDLNKVIAQDIILTDPKKDKKNALVSARVLSNRERFTKNLVAITLRPYAETIDYTADSVNGAFSLESSGGKALSIDWEHNSTNRIQLTTGFIAKMIDYKDDPDMTSNNLEFPSDNLFSFSGGLKYYLSSRLNLKSKITFDQGHYVNFRKVNTVTTPQLSRVTLTKMHFGFDLEAIRAKSGKFSLDLGVEGISNMQKDYGNLSFSRGFGYLLDISMKYWAESYWWMKAGFVMESMSHDLEGEAYTASHQVSSSGFLLSTGYAF